MSHFEHACPSIARFVVLLGGVAALAIAVAAAALPAQAATPASNPQPVATPLNKADADAWLDGFMPFALARGNIAGAVVVVVKDEQVLTERGFGHADIAAGKPVDPETTMFRVGSTSKLFTWTAVMQLVEQGKIDLDADVNRYLDFQIPPYEGQAITMRHIMTHTSGFDDVVKGGFSYSGRVDPLGDVVKRMLPPRIHAPGATPAYSNYATALAGYIVERVSGTPFDTYVERHIFEPLGMNHSSFRQPLPPALEPFMAKGYPLASVEAKPFELISVPPAGALSMSGADGARFMIAQLDGARGLLKPQTAREMQTPRYGAVSGLNRMALGFYEQRINDTYAIAHGGDLINFHGYLWLFPEKNTGLLLGMNSAGEGQATSVLRQALFEQFADRYFPVKDRSAPVELGTAKEHARMLEGSYAGSVAAFTTFLDIGNLREQYRIRLDPDGRPLVPEPLFDTPPRRWIETAPFMWQEATGHGRLAAVVEDGKVVRWSINEVSPFMVFDRVPWYRNAAWLLPLWLGALALVAAAALAWPARAFLRRSFDAELRPHGQALTAHRLVKAFCWLVIAVLAGWMYFLNQIVEPSQPPDWQLRVLQFAGTIGFVGLPALTLWRLVLTRSTGAGLERVWCVVLTLAAASILWVAFSFHLLSYGTGY